MDMSFKVDGRGNLEDGWDVKRVPVHKQIFVCATPGEGRCGEKGGCELLHAFRREVERLGYSPEIVQRNPCSRRHHEGPVVFIFPDDVWYTEVEPEDVGGIVDRHLSKSEARSR